MKFDDIVLELGEFGPYQQFLYFTTCLSAIPAGMQALSSVFVEATPDHRCSIPGLENDTYDSQGSWHDALIQSWIPWDNSTDAYDDCSIYRDEGTPANGTESCSSYVYSTDPYKSTFVSDTNLVCGQEEMVTYADMIYMAGMLVGSIVFGMMSDAIGRKTTLNISLVGMASTSIALSWASNYIAFTILRFCIGAFGVGVFLSAFVIGMELVGPSKRRIAGIVCEMFWCVGLFMETGIAYGLRDWKYFQLAISAPSVLVLVIFLIFLPESPRWLVQNGKLEQASKVIEKVARKNGVTLSEKAKDLRNLETEGEGEKIWKMFSYVNLLLRCLIIFYAWFVASMVYYGLSLNVGDLSGDDYLNFFLSALVEFVSYITCLIFLDMTGRKSFECGAMLLGGIACAATVFPNLYASDDLSWITTTLALIGKFGASAGFAVIYIYSAELFPTTVRNSGIGICSFAARIGGILAPYVGDMGNYISGDWGTALPMFIYGSLSILAGLLILFLPETSNKILPDTVEDARHFGESQKLTKENKDSEDANFKPSYGTTGETHIPQVTENTIM